MPVSLLPIVVPVLLVGSPFLFWRRGKRAFWLGVAGSATALTVLVLGVFIPGWLLRSRAAAGDAEAMYELARWSENHTGALQAFLPWPGRPDTEAGFHWLERSAALGHPPALYAVGVRLKYGQFVPADGSSVMGDPRLARSEKGQSSIDEAIRLGYTPKSEEQRFYWQEFRR